jgi:ubiquinone/menaquinone biosynthesis C-methylase UbiE
MSASCGHCFRGDSIAGFSTQMNAADSSGRFASERLYSEAEIQLAKIQLAKMRAYWRETHLGYLENVGTTFQAGRLAPHPGGSARHSNERLAQAACIRAGEVLLDAGCGVCGPAIDIVRHVGPVHIAGVTISPEQAATAIELIEVSGLAPQIQVMLADYHVLPFRDDQFDLAYFFESFGYSYDVDQLLSEIRRVLRPGGRIYIKDIFRSSVNSAAAEKELAEFDRTFIFHTRSCAEVCHAIERAGFVNIRNRDLGNEIQTDHTARAMFRSGEIRSGLTEFGQRHFRVYWQLPVMFAEIQASRPNGAT